METDAKNSPAVVSTQACVVYDTRSGEVVHIHELTALEGGYVPSEAEMMERTLELSRKSVELGPRDLEALIVEPESVGGDRSVRVDLSSKRLVFD